jgi:hypothetical protein
MLTFKSILHYARTLIGWLLGTTQLLIPFGCSDNNQTAMGSSDVETSAPKPEKMNVLTDLEKKEGWKLLFDGNSTISWKGYNQASFPINGWVVEDDMLMMEATGKEESGYGGDIITREQYENFEFKMDFKLSPGANGGILYLVKEQAGKPIWHSAPEYQLLDDEGFEQKQKYVMDKHRTGDNFDLMAATVKATKPVGEWNEALLRVKDGKVEHWLNGKKVLEYTLGSPEWKEAVKKSKFAKYPEFGMAKKGHIGIQDWGHPIWYRNIKIRPI